MYVDLPMPQPKFPVTISAHGGRFTATVDPPGLSATAPDEAAALLAITDKLNEHLRRCLDDRVPIPQPEVGDDEPFVVPNARLQCALLFQWHLGAMSKSDVVRHMATSWIRVDEIARAHRSAGIDLLDSAAAALGYRLVLSYEVDPTCPTPSR